MAQPFRIASILAFLAFPILEIGLLIRAGQWLGFWRLAFIVVATAMLGAAVIRNTGLSVLTKARSQMQSGTNRLDPLFEGLLQITSGMLLIFPGLISDAIGLILLLPIVRQALTTHVLTKLFSVRTYSEADPFRHDPSFRDSAPDAGPFDPEKDRGVTIEGEYEWVSEKTIDQDRSLKPRPQRRSAK